MPCDCTHDVVSGITHSLTKCPAHKAMQDQQRSPALDYYRDSGAIKPDGESNHEHYIAEFDQAFGKLIPGSGLALEIGCGASMYAKMLKDAGYHYIGIDSAPYGPHWTRTKFKVNTFWRKFEEFTSPHEAYSLIFIAHCLEHFENAPAMLKKMSDLLKPGGLLYIIVPDDTDLYNPDHLWFFTGDSLNAALNNVGLSVQQISMFRRIEREDFIYCLARKP